MFNSEREMQNTFVSLLKQRKTCGLIFEEVGNRNYFFRTDVVEYKSSLEIIGYELKLSNFKKVIEQSIKTLSLYDKSYIVIPDDKYSFDNFFKTLDKYPEKIKEKIGVILLDREKYKIFKIASKESNREYNNRYLVTLIQDLIIRGYHKEGINRCKNYK